MPFCFCSFGTGLHIRLFWTRTHYVAQVEHLILPPPILSADVVQWTVFTQHAQGPGVHPQLQTNQAPVVLWTLNLGMQKVARDNKKSFQTYF